LIEIFSNRVLAIITQKTYGGYMKKMNVIRIMMLLLCSSFVVDVQGMKRRRNVCEGLSELLSGCKRERSGSVATASVSSASSLAPVAQAVAPDSKEAKTEAAPDHAVVVYAPPISGPASSSPSSSPSLLGEAKTEAKTEEKPGSAIIAEACKFLDDNIDEALDKIMNGRSVHGFPSFYVKTSSAQSRITGAAKLQACITNNKLDLIFLPAKTIYNLRLDRVTTIECCIAEKILGIEGKLITFKQAKQLCLVMKETGFYDVGIDNNMNLILCGDGRIAIVDTEKRSFAQGLISLRYGLRVLCRPGRLEPGALEYVESELKKIEESEIKEPSAVCE